MSELTNLEICKRIAEIEGHETLPLSEYQKGDFYIVINDHGEGYNPLTDDALCFQLMVKYDCDLISPYRPNNDTHWECQIFTEDCADAVGVYDDSPNKAICFAIIEAHKVK
jgi:hypothetical protein